MREALEKIQRKIYLNSIGEQTQWKQGYEAGLTEAINIVENGISDLIVPNNNYYVIMYRNGDKYFPYIEEMKLYKISTKSRKSYCFSRNLNANIVNTKNPDLVLSSDKGLIERVFFTKEQAEKSIST